MSAAFRADLHSAQMQAGWLEGQLDAWIEKNGTSCREGWIPTIILQRMEGLRPRRNSFILSGRRRLFHQIKPPAGARGFSPDRYIMTSAVQAVLASVRLLGLLIELLLLCSRVGGAQNSNNCDGLGETGGSHLTLAFDTLCYTTELRIRQKDRN